MSGERLHTAIDSELRRTVPAPVAELAAQLARRGGAHTVAVLFYGSALSGVKAHDPASREPDVIDPAPPPDALEGVLDYYVLLDRVSAWKGSRVAALANRLLPPNVGYYEGRVAGAPLRAKYAVLSLEQFRDGMSANTLDTTLWARFSQPCVCVWARSAADREAVVRAVSEAVVTAARWAAELGPSSAVATEFWGALFARTYGAELRVERSVRSSHIVDRDAERYASMLPPAWSLAGIGFETSGDGRLTPRLTPDARRSAARRWAWRQRLGKPLNLLRLLKAAFTFDGAMDYVAWKVERHSGVRIEVTPWQRRFPLLAAPGLYWRLRRRGVLR